MTWPVVVVVWFYGTHFLYLSPTFSVRDKIYFGPKKCLSKSTWHQCVILMEIDSSLFGVRKKKKEIYVTCIILDVKCQKLKCCNPHTCLHTPFLGHPFTLTMRTLMIRPHLVLEESLSQCKNYELHGNLFLVEGVLLLMQKIKHSFFRTAIFIQSQQREMIKLNSKKAIHRFSQNQLAKN